MREASMPCSVTRQSLALTARCAAKSSTRACLCVAAYFSCFAVLAASSADASPTTTALASVCCFRSSATWSRQALASLSTRSGRFASFEKLIEHSACDLGAGGGGGGARMVIVVLADAIWFLSSDTPHVIPTAPVGAPADEYSAVVPVPVTVPAVAV